MPSRPYRNVQQVTCTLPIDLAERMSEAGLKPSVLLRAAVESALAGVEPSSIGDRLLALEKQVRAIRRKSDETRTILDAARALAFEERNDHLSGPVAVK